MSIKKKRRRLLEEGINNKVSQDLGGTVPGPLFRYLRGRDNTDRTKGDYTFWGYQKIIDFHHKSIKQSLPDDILIILGKNDVLSESLGRPVYLMYSKLGYPDTLVESVLLEDGQLEFRGEIKYSVLP